MALAGEDAPCEALEAIFLRLFLFEAGYPAPPAATPQDLVSQLPAGGWRPVPPFYLPPASGALFVVATGRGTVLRVGIVGGLERPEGVDGPAGREWFLAAQAEAGRAERVMVDTVSFWLIPPPG